MPKEHMLMLKVVNSEAHCFLFYEKRFHRFPLIKTRVLQSLNQNTASTEIDNPKQEKTETFLFDYEE
jgi:hypothetical protein